jgi:hypothetical protein
MRKKLPPEALRLCHAVGLATRCQVGRWVFIDTVAALLAPADRAREAALLEAAITSGLVEVNPGKEAHSIKLAAAGLDACHAALQPDRRRKR